MFKKNIGCEISKLIENNIIPDCLNYNLEKIEIVDWNKLIYDDYKTPEYYSKKFPVGWEYINGFSKIFEDMAINSKTPLEEIEDRKLESDKKYAEWKSIDNFDHILNIKSNN